jgi:hypothetical protein
MLPKAVNFLPGAPTKPMSRESFLTSAEWTKVRSALMAMADHLVHDSMENVLNRDPKAIVHAAGVIEGLQMAARWPEQNLKDEDSPAPSPDPAGTVSVKQKPVNGIPRLQDTF